MSRAKGNARENRFCAMAKELGFCTFCARGSLGPIDVLCFHTTEREMPSLVVQVGGWGKRIAANLRELSEAPRPIGSRCILAREYKVGGRWKWRFDTTDSREHLTLLDAISAKGD